jgi:N-acyl-D-aspartate/D-glutamate deacylase
MVYDLLIKGARVVDGSGMPGYMGDVAVQDGRIAEIGRVHDSAKRTIDADGLVLAPGFIDQHTHMDAHLLWDPAALPLPEHGVTSLVTGNCGLSLMPAHRGDESALIGNFVRVEAIPRSILETLEWRWGSTADYLGILDQRLGVNVASIVGHNAIRQFVMGDDATEREATTDEIAAMQDAMRQAMRDGAIGYSINRNPTHFRDDGKPLPSRISTEDELLQVAGVLAEFGAGVVQHSSFGRRNVDDIDWVARLGEASGRPVLWTGVNYQPDQPDIWREQLDCLEPHFQRGLRLFGNTNIVPFAIRFSLKNAQFFDMLPAWRSIMVRPVDQRSGPFGDPALRPSLRELDPAFATRVSRVKVLQPALPENRELRGKTIAELAQLRGAPHIVDALLDVAVEENLETLFLASSPIEDEMGEIVRSPYTIVGQSDAGAHVQFISNFGVCTSLLGQYVRERQLLSLEEAVRQLTFKVANVFGIKDRGLVWPGWAADLVLFDPDTVEPLDTESADDYPGGFTRVLQHARGMHYTIVNGEVLIDHGQHTGAYPGHVIRNSAAKVAMPS